MEKKKHRPVFRFEAAGQVIVSYILQAWGIMSLSQFMTDFAEDFLAEDCDFFLW